MDLVHCIIEPEGDGPFPTLFALHGWGANGLDLLSLAPHLMGGELLVIAPNGPLRVPIGGGAHGCGWFPISSGGPLDRSGFDIAREALDEFIEAASKRYAVDTSRSLLLGFSQGGVMAYDLALRDPDRWAALIALSTWLPEELSETYEPSASHALLPALVQHGNEDPMIPVERAEASVRRLRGLGLPVTYQDYSMGHTISAESLTDMNRWLAGEAFPRGS